MWYLIFLGLSIEESAAIELFNRLPSPPVDVTERKKLLDELHQVQADLKEHTRDYVQRQQKLTRCAANGGYVPDLMYYFNILLLELFWLQRHHKT